MDIGVKYKAKVYDIRGYFFFYIDLVKSIPYALQGMSAADRSIPSISSILSSEDTLIAAEFIRAALAVPTLFSSQSSSYTMGYH